MLPTEWCFTAPGGYAVKVRGQNIVARELSLEAAFGSIGSLNQRIAAQLDQGHRRLLTDTDVPSKKQA